MSGHCRSAAGKSQIEENGCGQQVIKDVCLDIFVYYPFCCSGKTIYLMEFPVINATVDHECHVFPYILIVAQI
jgi:hypothetical protein